MTAAADAVVVALITAAAVVLAATIGLIGIWRQTRRATNELHPNAGSTLRDAVDRIEATIRHDVIPRLDRGAQVAADHADRIATLETKRKARP